MCQFATSAFNINDTCYTNIKAIQAITVKKIIHNLIFFISLNFLYCYYYFYSIREWWGKGYGNVINIGFIFDEKIKIKKLINLCPSLVTLSG